MGIPGGLKTTAMAVMPHKQAEAALQTALSLDIPFWPQLPNLSYREDMYVQAAEHFPGIVLDFEGRRLWLDTARFYAELEEALAHWEEPEYFDISPDFSLVYHEFLGLDLRNRPAIRGQLEGPISFGLNVADENGTPILFSDEIRPFMLEFMAKRVDVQLARLKRLNSNAFMYVDEPGLQYLFSAMSGYSDTKARADLEVFFAQIERPRGVHLCGNPDWDFLLGLDLDILSLDVYSNGEIFAGYAKSVQRFLDTGAALCWGITPTNFEPFEAENIDSLEARLTNVWDVLARRGVDREQLVARSLISPATCCLVNPDGEKTVDRAFEAVRALSRRLREKNGLA